MRYILSIAIILLSNLNILSAQDSYSLLYNMSHLTQIDSSISGKYSFVYYEKDVTTDQEGNFVLQHKSIKVDNDQFMIFSDGKTRYVCNKMNEEIIIAEEDSTATNISDNPWIIFNSIESNPAYTYSKKYTTEYIKGIKCGVISLNEKNNIKTKATYVLYIDVKTKLPVKIIYLVNDNQTVMSMTFNAYSYGTLKPADFFVPSPEMSDSYYITDLR